MTPDEVQECLKIVKNSGYNPEIDVSGGITLETVSDYDFPGVSRLSIGALTHSVKSLDISLLIK